MFRKLLTLLLVVVICVCSSISVSAYTDQYVFDYSYSLSYDEIQELEEMAGQIEYEYGYCVMFCITDKAVSENYAQEMYDTYTDNENGVIFIHDTEDGVYQYYVTDSAKLELDSDELARLQAAYDSNDTYFGGIQAYFEAAEYLFDFGDTEIKADEYEYAMGDGLVDRTKNTAKVIAICIVAGMALGFIIIFAIASKNKSVKMQANATVYTRPGSFVVTGSYDNFLYKTLDKTPKPKQNDKK